MLGTSEGKGQGCRSMSGKGGPELTLKLLPSNWGAAN